MSSAPPADPADLAPGDPATPAPLHGAARGQDLPADERWHERGALGWLLLHDPAWEPAQAGEEPPAEVVAGGWPLHADDAVGAFHVNAVHRAAVVDQDRDRDLDQDQDQDGDGEVEGDPDPVGVVLELLAADRAPLDLLLWVLRDCVVHVAMNGDGRPLVVHAEEGGDCLVVATCWERRRESDPPDWREAAALELAELAGDHLGVLLNPFGPAPAHLSSAAVHEVAAATAEGTDLELGPLLEVLRGLGPGPVGVLLPDAATAPAL